MVLVLQHIRDHQIFAPYIVWHQFRDIGLHASGLADKSMLVHPVVVDKLGDVVSDIVRANDDASFSLTDVVLFDVAHASSHRGSRAASTQETFLLNQSTRIVVGFVIVTFVPLVYQASIRHSGNEIVTNSFNLIPAFWTWLVQRFGFS